jgi:hypothetical protein
MLIFSYRHSYKTKYIFLINVELKKIMYLSVSAGDHTIFQEQNIQKFSHNSFDDVGAF